MDGSIIAECQWQQSFEYSRGCYRWLRFFKFIERKGFWNISEAFVLCYNRDYDMAILKFKEAYRLSLKSSVSYYSDRSLNNVAFSFSL